MIMVLIGMDQFHMYPMMIRWWWKRLRIFFQQSRKQSLMTSFHLSILHSLTESLLVNQYATAKALFYSHLHPHITVLDHYNINFNDNSY